MNFVALFFVLYLKVCLISCQSQCKNFQTCGGCIGYAHEKCVWCPAKDHTGRRCQSKSSLDPLWCKEHVYDPADHDVKAPEEDNKNFNDDKDKGPIIQFKPQAMEIKARTNVPIKINMSYKPANHYPLDVYYLVDSSGTMKIHKDNLFKQALEIYNQLSKITNNVRLGVGSFIEKPALPYVFVTTQESYSFKHHQSLTNDTDLFSKALKELKKINGTNNDEPEADLDALMQVMVCKDEIGWRNNSTRIILLSTDSTYHSAGDGKFVGAIKPNDMQCHLDNNEYKMALTFDYPSVSQINKVATENKIMIIFAADPKVQNDYMALEKKIKNAKYVPLFGKSDVVNMITKEYQEIIRSVQIDASIPPFMSLTFEPDCTRKDECKYEHNKSVDIVGTLMIKYCPTDNKYNYEVKIGPVSIDERLTLKVTVDCQCDCEKPGHGEKDSDKCSKAGTYQCGICYCNPERHGDICNCNGTVTSGQDFDKCKANLDDPKSCSGRGDCRCGKCINCQEGFSGDFCEFDDNSCERPGGVLCSGRGKCTFGKCECEPNWLPTDCRCPNNNNSCIAPNSKEPCSGRGNCVCGQCVCNSATEYCVGSFCDECPESASTRCLELNDYAYCNFNENKTVCDEKYNFTDTDVILVNKTSIYTHRWFMAKMWCRKVLDDGRILVYRYHYPKSAISSTLRLIIQDELDMPAVADVWVAVGSVIGAVLLIGIITIVAWKILVDLHDKREYEKFEKDSADAGYDVSLNPLYHSPATNFLNPAYNNCS
ncbi:integrin beta-PS-like [Maniola hyperantus]|uniref:integrin beta-PS-like n=1 Tax=Aphantopus hyperantus TaxID=2795564 RepID=UPI00156A2FB6|nr:integrin beta-PS-like isoform X1 [Maniola hyperantus]